MENLKEYFQKSQRWLPCVGKAPRRIRTSSIDWNIIGNQYTAKEVWEYKKDNPAIGWGTVVFKNDPLIVVDIDGLTDAGIDYINRFNTLPLANTAVSTVLDKLTIKDTLVEKSLSGKGLHIYLLLDKEYDIPALSRYEETLGGMCKHIELFNGGSNEDSSKGKFIVYTGNIIKDFKLDFSTTNVPVVEQPTKDNILAFTDVNSLPVYTHKYPVKKLLDILLDNPQFELLFNKGILFKEQDLNVDTLEAVKEEVTDTSRKVFKMISIIVSNCQNFETIDKVFKQSFFYKHTHWGLEGKWERLISVRNNSNPILSAYNAKVMAARSLGKPDYFFFKGPYTTEIVKEKNREIRSEAKEALQLNTLNKIKSHIQNIMDMNEFLYSEYTKIDETFKKFDIENLDLDMLESDKYLSEMYWSLYPFTFAINNDSQKDWITYDIEKKQYVLLNRESLRIHITNLLMELFPNKSHSFRKNVALATLDYYETLQKPIVDISKTNDFISLNQKEKGYYYKVKNGILDVYNAQLLENTPTFLSFSEFPFEVDEHFLEALRTKNINPVIKGTLFERFLYSSFPIEMLQEELLELNNNSKLINEEGNIYKLANSNSSYRFSSQLVVLQKMLGYTIIPRHMYNSDKALILYGVAGSGKSTLAKLLGYLLTGRKDLSGLTTSFCALEKNQYALAPFKTAPIIVVNELPDRFSSEIRGTLNALISGESVDINEKFKPNYSMQLPGKIVLIGNVLPKIIDASGSLTRRSVIVNFPVNVSKTENAIDHIDDKLIEPENLRAFFLFCLIGALDVLKTKYTVISKIGYELLMKMEQQNNPVEEVLKETTEFITDEEFKEDMMYKNLLIPKTDLINHIKDFLTSNYNFTPYTIKTWPSLGGLCSGIASYIAKHFNQPEHYIYGKMTLGNGNKYKKHSTPVEAFRGLKLKNFIPETQEEDDLEGVF